MKKSLGVFPVERVLYNGKEESCFGEAGYNEKRAVVATALNPLKTNHYHMSCVARMLVLSDMITSAGGKKFGQDRYFCYFCINLIHESCPAS